MACMLLFLGDTDRLLQGNQSRWDKDKIFQFALSINMGSSDQMNFIC